MFLIGHKTNRFFKQRKVLLLGLRQKPIPCKERNNYFIQCVWVCNIVRVKTIFPLLDNSNTKVLFHQSKNCSFSLRHIKTQYRLPPSFVIGFLTKGNIKTPLAIHKTGYIPSHMHWDLRNYLHVVSLRSE